MSAKEYLKKLRRLNLMIRTKQNEIDRYRSRSVSVSPGEWGEKVSSSGSRQRMADAVDAYVDIERNELLPLKDQLRSILETLDRLGNTLQYIVLYEHYYSGKSFTEIAEENHYSYAHVLRIHCEGMKALESLMGDDRK